MMRDISPDNRWLGVMRAAESPGIRLFCFPHSGAGASVYYSWRNALPPGIQVCPVQLPGRETRLTEQAYSSLPMLIAGLVEGLRPYLNRPFAFFGHSLGALVSFELARHLRQQDGVQPLHLFVSGYRAPQLPKDKAPVHALPEPEFLAELQRLNGTPAAVLEQPELLALLLPLLRADFAVSETYQYHSELPLDCPITALGGLQDGDVTREHLAAWSVQTSAGFKLRMFPGDHFYLQSARQELIKIIALELSPALQRIAAQNP